LVSNLTKGTKIPRPVYKKIDGYYVDKDNKRITELKDFHNRDFERDANMNPKVQMVTYEDIERETIDYNKRNPTKPLRAEEYFFQENQVSQIIKQKGALLQYESQVEMLRVRKRQEEEALDRLPVEEQKRVKADIVETEGRIREYEETIALQKFMEAEELKKIESGKFQSLHNYAKKKSVESYAQLGIEAMQTQKEWEKKGKITHDIHVGPELGWPTAWGGHPREFTELVVQSREKMKDMLMKPEIVLPDGTKKKNEFYQPGISKETADELSKKHIQGMLDTSHLGMWFDYMDSKPGETFEQKKTRFNEWFMDEVKHMEKNKVIGGVQAVDAISGAHAHLPPGQGMFPVVEAVTHLKKQGWKGAIISEGHEEDSLMGGQKGRIQFEAWKAFGVDVGAGQYMHAAGQWRQTKWSDLDGGYFGNLNPPNYLYGQNTPDPEGWQFWSGMRLE